MKRHALVFFLIAFLVVTLFVVKGAIAAASNYTADEAIDWAKGKVGTPVGIDDGSGYYQCVEFIQAYYEYLGVSKPYGNAYDYATNSLPDGWIRTQGGIPQKGDILVYSKYSDTVQQYGHVAIYESDNSLYDQDGSVYGATVKHETANYKTYTYNYWGCIHPDFKKEPIIGSEMSTGYNREIADGDYLIVPTENSSFFMDIYGTDSPAKNGTEVQLCSRDNSKPAEYDVWTLTYKNGFYTIRQKGTNMYLDVEEDNGSKLKAGTKIQVWEKTGATNQQWAISKNGGGYRIQARCSGFSIDIANAAFSGGTKIQQYPNNDTIAQRWTFIKYPDGFQSDIGSEMSAGYNREIADGDYLIVPTENSSFFMDIYGSDRPAKNGTDVKLWSRDNSKPAEYDVWTLTYKNGFYTIRQKGTNMYLDVEEDNGSKLKAGTKIQVWEKTGATNQQWAISKNGAGYRIQARCSGFSIDIANAAFSDGTKIQQYPNNDTISQRWTFIKYPDGFPSEEQPEVVFTFEDTDQMYFMSETTAQFGYIVVTANVDLTEVKTVGCELANLIGNILATHEEPSYYKNGKIIHYFRINGDPNESDITYTLSPATLYKFRSYVIYNSKKYYSNWRDFKTLGDAVVLPTVGPTRTPIPSPAVTPTVSPAVTPTTKPTATPTVKPTAIPTAIPTAEPTAKPTATPTAAPTPQILDEVIVNGGVYRLNHTNKTATFLRAAKKTVTKLKVNSTVKANGNKYSVTAIKDEACKGLQKLTTLTIGAKVRAIGKSAFADCPALKTVNGGARITTIGVNAFANCSKLTTVATLEKATKISDGAFQKTGLKKIAFGTKLTTIGKNAFAYCTSMTKIEGGTAVTTIEAGAFIGCTKLEKLTVLSKLTTIGDSVFKDCKALTKVTLSAKVTTVGKNAFNGCVKLKTIAGGKAVTKIGAGAFSGCTGLTTLPAFEKLTTIGDNAFKGCKAITKITLSEKVKSIGKNAFNGCAKLKTIVIRTKQLKDKNVGADAFKGIYSKPTVTCPKDKLKDYKKLLPKKGMPKGTVYK